MQTPLPAPPRTVDRAVAGVAWRIKRCAALWSVALLLLVIALLLAVRNLSLYLSDLSVFKDGSEIMATIEEVGEQRVTDQYVRRRWAAKFEFAVRVRYKPANARKSILGFIVIDPKKQDRYPVGQRTAIRYDPDSPRHMIGADQRPLLLDRMLPEAMVGLLGLVFLLAAWLRRRGLLKLYRDGVETGALVRSVKSTVTGLFSRQVGYAYQYNGRRMAGSDVAPQRRLTDYPVGSRIQLLVDPNRPDRTILALHFFGGGRQP